MLLGGTVRSITAHYVYISISPSGLTPLTHYLLEAVPHVCLVLHHVQPYLMSLRCITVCQRSTGLRWLMLDFGFLRLGCSFGTRDAMLLVRMERFDFAKTVLLWLGLGAGPRCAWIATLL